MEGARDLWIQGLFDVFMSRPALQFKRFSVQSKQGFLEKL